MADLVRDVALIQSQMVETRKALLPAIQSDAVTQWKKEYSLAFPFLATNRFMLAKGQLRHQMNFDQFLLLQTD